MRKLTLQTMLDHWINMLLSNNDLLIKDQSELEFICKWDYNGTSDYDIHII